jgi:MFS family permease
VALSRNLVLIYAAAFLRSLGVGLTGVILGIYLSRIGFSATLIGVVIGSGLAGSALATLIVSFRADRLGRRRTLISLSLLMSLGGLGLALTTDLPGLLLLSFLGMLNGMGRDRGAGFALEQAIIPETSVAERRTWALAWYSLVLDAGHALGALAGTIPFFFRRWLEVDLLASYHLAFALYAASGLLSTVLYLFLSPQIEIVHAAPFLEGTTTKISPQSRKVVTKLAALSGMDSLGGGFLTSAPTGFSVASASRKRAWDRCFSLFA